MVVIKEFIFETRISKIYILLVALISLFILGGYFSYAMFTVSKEKSNAISIVTGNLTYDLRVNGTKTNTITIGANSKKTFSVVLSNPNNKIARFNLYYVGSLPSNVEVGYITGDAGITEPPSATGRNLQVSGTSGSSNNYNIRVNNNSSSSVTITLGVQVGLDYNNLSLPSNGHLFNRITIPISDTLIEKLSSGSTYNDSEDTFITGSNPNNYIWYSGKLWRAVSINNSTKTVKIVTEDTITSIPYSSALTSGTIKFEASFIKEWLNDTSVDGFLGNLRDYHDFVAVNYPWNATSATSTSKPSKEEIEICTVGLLTLYEYYNSYRTTTYSNGYLNNGLYWWTLTPYDSSYIQTINTSGNYYRREARLSSGVRPSVNLKANNEIVFGSGTKTNPYRLKGDNDTSLYGTRLNTRYSGEYVKFGTGGNTLYRIVSHENGSGTKITSAEPLKDSGSFKTMAFGSSTNYSSTNTIGSFLNGSYLTSYVGTTYSNMINDGTTWYLGMVSDGVNYKLAKYTTDMGTTLTSSRTTAKVGLLRLGELMSGQSNASGSNTSYWTITPYSSSYLRVIYGGGDSGGTTPTGSRGIRPAFNLKSGVYITGGGGTKENPFTIWY